MATLWKVGGSAGIPAYIELTDAPSIVVSDGSTTSTLTAAILAGLTKISGFVWDLTGATTGAAYVSLTDALASALDYKVGSTSLLKLVTNALDAASARGPRVKFGRPFVFADAQVITIAANHALVFGTAGSNETQIGGNVYLLNNTSGSSKNLTLPTYAHLGNGFALWVINIIGGSDVVVKDSGGTTICTIASGKGAFIGTNGTAGGAILGA